MKGKFTLAVSKTTGKLADSWMEVGKLEQKIDIWSIFYGCHKLSYLYFLGWIMLGKTVDWE